MHCLKFVHFNAEEGKLIGIIGPNGAGATAYLLTDRLPIMLSISAMFGILSAVIGMYYSVVYDVA